MRTFAPAIFLGAFLLFLVQPLIGKYILPWFGGGPGVWTICLLFFQLLLLGGYAYAHLISRYLSARRQAVLHLLLLVGALALLPITPRDYWKPHDASNPVWRMLGLLLGSVGAPYFLLSATGPLLQHWFSRVWPDRSPYRLYALSNAGSFLALGAYPLFFEPNSTRQCQAALWGFGLVAFVIACAFCAVKIAKLPVTSSPQSSPRSQPPPIDDQPITPALPHYLLWLLLPACASILLLAVTNKLCQDVAVIPFLWVLPLALYLLSFTFAFAGSRWYPRFPFALALIAAETAICWALFHESNLSVIQQIALYGTALFICCMVCHGELYRLRPAPRHLTAFYLLIAAGGALGGLFVALIAPLILKDYYELNLGLFLCATLLLIIWFRIPRANHSGEIPWKWFGAVLLLFAAAGLFSFWLEFGQEAWGRQAGWIVALAIIAGFLFIAKKVNELEEWRRLTFAALAAAWVALGITLWMQTLKTGGGLVDSVRNFYGVLTVYEQERDQPKFHHFRLQHGRTAHGLQIADPQRATWPTAYYGEKSGVGLALQVLPATPRRIGLVGLGAGTIVTYARGGDSVRIYELNPDVIRLASTRFTYLSRCAADIAVVPGDARLSLEREPPGQFDLLVLDAFNSDAVPAHLLTREAFVLYQRHLKTNAIIAIHISNQHLRLAPVLQNVAREFRFNLAAIDYGPSDAEWWLYPSTWILLSHDQEILNSPTIRQAAAPLNDEAGIPLWTDNFASLFQILK